MNGADPDGDVFRLVYHSETALDGAADAVDREIERILVASRRNNARVGVTGALMFNRGFFAQVLEGERQQIESVFERIQRDPRHTNLVVLQFAPAPERAFAAWSMAFVGGSAADARRFGHMAEASGFRPADFDADGLYQLLRDMLLRDEKSFADRS